MRSHDSLIFVSDCIFVPLSLSLSFCPVAEPSRSVAMILELEMKVNRIVPNCLFYYQSARFVFRGELSAAAFHFRHELNLEPNLKSDHKRMSRLSNEIIVTHRARQADNRKP